MTVTSTFDWASLGQDPDEEDAEKVEPYYLQGPDTEFDEIQPTNSPILGDAPALSYKRRKAMIDAGAVPTMEISEVAGPLPGDPGFEDSSGFLKGVTGAIPLAGHTIMRTLGAPAAGLLEISKVLPEGTSQGIKERYEQERLQYLAGNPHWARAWVAGGMEMAANLIPVAKTKWIAKTGMAAATGVNRMAKLAGVSGKPLTAAEKIAYRAAPAGLEAGLFGLGEAADQPWEKRILAAGIASAAGAGLATAAGFGASIGDASARNINRRMESTFDRLPKYLDEKTKTSLLSGELGIEEAAYRSVNARPPLTMKERVRHLAEYDLVPEGHLTPGQALQMQADGKMPNLTDVLSRHDMSEKEITRIFMDPELPDTYRRRAKDGLPITLYGATSDSGAILPGAPLVPGRTAAQSLAGTSTGKIGSIDVMPDEIIPMGKGEFIWAPKDADTALKKVRLQDPTFGPDVQTPDVVQMNLINGRINEISEALTPEIARAGPEKISQVRSPGDLALWMKRSFMRNMLSMGDLRAIAYRFNDAPAERFIGYQLPRYLEQIPQRKNSILNNAERIRSRLDKEIASYSRTSGKSIEEIGDVLTQARMKEKSLKLDDTRIRMRQIDRELKGVNAAINEHKRAKVADRKDPSAQHYANSLDMEMRSLIQERSQLMAERADHLSKVRSAYGAMPKSLRDVYGEAGDFIDDLSREFMNEGLITEGQVDLFKTNMGKYVHVTHAKHETSDWARRVEDSQVWDEAYDWFRNSFGDKSNLPPSERWTDGKIMAAMLDIVNRKEGADFFTRTVGSRPEHRQVFSETQTRGVLSQPIRRLMGVHETFQDVFPRTVKLMVHDLVTTQTRQQVIRDGLRTGAFTAQPLGRSAHAVPLDISPGAKTRQKGLDKRAKVLRDGQRDVYADKAAEGIVYADKELADMLNGYGNMDPAGVFGMISGLIKWGKIGYSPQTQVRNAASGVIMTMANGVFNPMLYKSAPRMWRDFFRGELSTIDPVKEMVGSIDELFELGIISPGTTAGDLLAWRNDVNQKIRGSADPAAVTGRAGKIREGMRVINDKVVKGYETTDSVFRALNYFSELKSLTKAAGDDKATLNILQDIYGTRNLKEIAAERAKETYQTYARTPAIGKKLSRNLLTSAFATFHVEAPRNLLNNIKLMRENWMIARATGNNKMKMLSRKRFMGLVASLTMLQSWKHIQNKRNGVDREKDEAFRETFAYDFAKNNELVYDEDLNVGGKRIVRFTDLSYMQPQQMLSTFWNIMARQDMEMGEKFGAMADATASLYLGWELATGAILEQVINRRVEGSPMEAIVSGKAIGARLYNPEDPISVKAKARMLSAYNKLAPGLGNFGMRVLRSQVAFFDPRDPDRFDPMQEIAAQATGRRSIPVDMERGFQNRVYQFNERKGDISSSVNAAERDVSRGAPVSRAENAWRNSYNRWNSAYGEMMRHVNNARTWGFTDEEIEDMFRNKATGKLIISQEVVDALLDGDVNYSYLNVKEPTEVTPATLD